MTSDAAENLVRYLSCTERTSQGKDSELILTVKMETRQGETYKFCEQFLCFFLENDPYGKIFKIMFQKFTWRHRSMWLCSNVVKFVWQKISDIMHYLVDRKNKTSAASQKTVTTVRIAPKICHGQPPTMCSQCSRFHTIDSLSAES